MLIFISSMDVAAAVIIKEGKILIAKRKEGKWEFPGGRIERGETVEECLKREIEEELAVKLKNIRSFVTVKHTYPFGEITLHVFTASYVGDILPKEHEEIRWIGVDEINDFDFMEADKKVVEKIIERREELGL